MANNYLQLAADVVDALGRIDNLQFNEIQCQVLKEKLQETVMPLLSQVDMDSLPPEKRALFQQCCQGAALLEFYRIVKDAEAIILGCCAPNWIRAAVKLANHFEAFVDIFFKLDWCASVVGIVISSALTNDLQDVVDNIEGFGEVECVFKMQQIRNMLRQPALEDRELLRRRLTEMQEDTSAPDRQEIIAYLLKLVATDPTNMEPTTINLLPSIDHRSLVKGGPLDRGSYAQVFVAQWIGQEFAGKIFPSLDSNSFRVEANIFTGLSHPNIVQVCGVSSDSCGSGSIVMEVMHTDIMTAIARGTFHREQVLDLPVAVDIMLQVAEAMQYLHQKRITHQDLKPSNILINPAKIPEIAKAGYMEAKVADFGVSKIVQATATFSTQTEVGTTLYMAPELFGLEQDNRTMRYPLKSDVYSYGITCSEIIMGRRPFEKILLHKLREEVKAGLRPTLPNSLPNSLSSLIKSCWDADVQRRPSFSRIATELRHLKAIYLINGLSEFGGPFQTFTSLPFIMAQADVDIEIETDDKRLQDIDTLVSMLHDLQQQVQEKDQTVYDLNQTLRVRDQTIQELRAKHEGSNGKRCVVL